MLKLPIQESIEQAEEKLRSMKRSIGDRTATASEVNEFNRLENIIYKERALAQKVITKKLNNSILALTVKIEDKELRIWSDWEYFNAEVEFRKLANECMWNQVDFQEILKTIKAEGVSIADFNKLTNDEKNVIINNYKKKKI